MPQPNALPNASRAQTLLGATIAFAYGIVLVLVGLSLSLRDRKSAVFFALTGGVAVLIGYRVRSKAERVDDAAEVRTTNPVEPDTCEA